MPTNDEPHRPIAVVVIGRNEGVRLKRCIGRLLNADNLVVYVDSGSTDGSREWALQQGVDVVALDLTVPFTAARARNAGFERVRATAPNLPYVQFLDGDCELSPTWLSTAPQFLDRQPAVAAVTGRLRERHPERSVYNWLCEQEWSGPVGEIRYCAGNVMMRATALEAVGGYRNELIAGEEPELSIRLREVGWRLWRIDESMAIHDADMSRFSQWWRRSVRSGYAYALGASLHGQPPGRHFVWEGRRALLWGLYIPVAILTLFLLLGLPALGLFVIYPLQLLRQTLRSHGRFQDRFVLASFQLLSKFPEAIGQLKFRWHRIRQTPPAIIEHKASAQS